MSLLALDDDLPCDPVELARYEQVEVMARQDARDDRWDRELGPELEDLRDHYDEILQEELTEMHEEGWSPDLH